MPGCPDREELQWFLNDCLSAELESQVLSHVDGCASCQEALEQLTAGAHTLKHLVRAGVAVPLDRKSVV